MHSKNASHRILPKTLYYTSDGTGRDGYIGVNSGGLCANTEGNCAGRRREIVFRDLKKKYQNPFTPKVVHYHSDGSGRDKYIKINEGGLTPNGASSNFIKALRGYSKTEVTSSFACRPLSSTLRETNERLSRHREYEDPYKGVFYRPKTPAEVRAQEREKKMRYMY